MTTRAHAKVITAGVLALVFASGALVGRAWNEKVVAPTDGPAGEQAEEGREGRRRTPMYEQVGLTDLQLVQVDSIVVHYRNEVREEQREAREEWERRYAELVDALRNEIKSVMNAEQRTAYDSLLAQYDERRREWRENRREEGNRDNE